MAENEKQSLRQFLANGSCINNAWMTIGDAYLAEIVAASRQFAAVTLDMQHGLIDQKAAIDCIRAIQGFDCFALVRLPQLDSALIGILLDAAIDGLVLPQTDSADEARRFMAACHYPPQGKRSFGPTRAGLQANPADREFATFCMIETSAGLQSVHDIASVDGLTGLFIGPGDLGISLGIGPGQDRSEPEFEQAVTTIKTAANSHEKVLGIHANSVAFAAKMAAAGFQLVTTWVDVLAIKQTTQDSGNSWRQLAGELSDRLS